VSHVSELNDEILPHRRIGEEQSLESLHIQLYRSLQYILVSKAVVQC